MGFFSDSKEEIESKGAINNNVIVSDQMKENHNEMRTIMYVIAVVIIFSVIIKLFQIYNKIHKKKYTRNQLQRA